MKKLFIFIALFSFFCSYSQLYKRAWSTLLSINYSTCPDQKRPNCHNDTIYHYNNLLVAHVDHKTNTLFHTDRTLTRINKTTTTNPNFNLFYTIPTAIGGSLIESVKTTSKGEVIICGRTLVSGLATAGAYSTTFILSSFTGSGYIAKIDTSGKLVWFTYFHPIVQNTSSLTIDKNDNIYVLTNREKTETLTANTFQSAGDPTHPLIYINAISKLDSNGNHQWSTFYGKDQSKIRSIVAANNGLYISGEHSESSSTSNYFGTVGSYQEYATGTTSGGTNNANMAFLSKFNFDGTRAWSSYFGIDRSYNTLNTLLLYYNTLAVIGDDAYILNTHEITPIMTKNPTTTGAYITNQVSKTGRDITLTKFLGNGKRDWTTFLHDGKIIQSNNSDLFISSVINNTNTYLSTLTTNNAHQKNHGGKDDSHLLLISSDGKKMNYGSFYGFNGIENSLIFPTTKGYFNIGYTYNNTLTESQTFVTSNAPLKKYVSDYNKAKFNLGNFLSYFTTETLSTESFNKNNFSIYPNPTTDILNIEFKDILPENTLFTVYNIAGKKVLIEKAQPTSLNQINVSNLSTGVYILQVDSDGANHSVKFIKK